jgi:alkylhydroperoxidase family enzyme
MTRVFRELPHEWQMLCDAALKSSGHIAPDLRHALALQAAGEARPGSPPPGISAELAAFVNTIAHHAYQVTDEAVAALKNQGLSEDAIFEATVAAALGASASRYRHALRVLA